MNRTCGRVGWSRFAGAALVVPALLVLPGCAGRSTVSLPAAPASSASSASGSGSEPPSEPASPPADPSASSASASASDGELVATTRSLGPARIGQPLAAFARALGHRAAPAAAGEGDNGCWIRSINGLPGVTVMVLKKVDGPVRRVDISAPTVRTAAGVGVGSTEEEVRAAYPGAVRAEPHKYVTGGQYLTTGSAGYDLVFETDEKHVVTTYRFGESDPVSWVETCS